MNMDTKILPDALADLLPPQHGLSAAEYEARRWQHAESISAMRSAMFPKSKESIRERRKRESERKHQERAERVKVEDEVANRIIAVVCDYFHVTPDELVGDSRFRSVAGPREILALILRRRGIGCMAVGRAMHREHTTALKVSLYAHRTAKKDPVFRRWVEEIEQRVTT